MAARNRSVTCLALVTLVFGVVLQSAAADFRGPASPEGAWYGMVVVTNLPGVPPIPATDIYSSNTTRPMRQGTVLCTVASEQFPLLVDGQIVGWVRQALTGSGSWLRVDTRKVAVTVWRLAFDMDTGAPAGWIKNWGTGMMPSNDRLTTLLKAQFYGLDGVPIGTPIASTVSSVRVQVDVEEPADQQ